MKGRRILSCLSQKNHIVLLLFYYIQNSVASHRDAEMMIFLLSIVTELENDMDIINLFNTP